MATPQIHLASKSPRRQQLLRQLGIDFDILKLREAAGRDRDIVEGARDAEPPLHYVERMARTKVGAGWQRMHQRKLPERPVLSADTEVVLDGVIFGKPTDAEDAKRMLQRLSGRTHQVMTAVAVRWHERTEFELSISSVAFRRLTSEEIDHYVATGEPDDKAGAYAIQGKAAAFITRIDGSFSGVVGLPLAETAELLARLGMPVL
ncbi:MAG TPA: Maf family protein [Casimicrobiaceae bacterium]|jgi:septum formation protein